MEIEVSAVKSIRKPFQLTLHIRFHRELQLRFLEVFYESDALKRVTLGKRQMISNLFRAKISIRVVLNAFPLPGIFKLNVQGYSRKYGHINLGEVTIDKPTTGLNYSRPDNPLNAIVMTSLGRSGSTLFMNLLARHPAIACSNVYPFESTVARRLMKQYVKGAIARIPIDNEILSFLVKGSSDSIEAESRVLNEYSQSHIISSIQTHYYNLGLSSGKSAHEMKYFIEKNLRPIFLIDKLFPSNKKIFLVRDFRDMIISSLAFNKKRGYKAFGRQYAATDHDFVKFKAQEARKWLLEPYEQFKGSSLLVRYEDLIVKPKEELKRIFEFLSVDCDSDCTDQIMKSVKSGSKEFGFHLTSSSAEDSIGKWKSYQDEKLIKTVNTEFKEYFETFQYQI